MTEVVTKVQKLRIYRPNKTQFESVSPDPYAVYAVDPEFNGEKLLVTDEEDGVVESTLGPDDIEQKASVVALSAVDSITLTDNTIFNGSTQTSLSIALWSAPSVSSITQVVFSSGATETSLSFPGTINWFGDDLIYDATLQKFIFGPVSNKRYTIMFYYDGVTTIGIVKGV